MKINNIFKYACIIASMAGSSTALAQNAQAPQTQENVKPLELPTFIIEGAEQIDMRSSGVKQFPTKVPGLKNGELDSLNGLEKQSATLLPTDPLPTRSILKDYKKGYISGAFGMFTTPEVSAGYESSVAGYRLFANGFFDASSGDAKRSEYNKFGFSLNSDFIAPDKFWIFGGSRTRTGVFLNSQSYNLYGSPQSQNASGYKDRTATKAGLKIDVDGAFENVQFSTGAVVKTTQISQDSKANGYSDGTAGFDNDIGGYLKAKSLWNNYLVSGALSVDFRSVNRNAVNFIQLGADASYFEDLFSATLKAGLQTANNSAGINRSGLLLGGDLEYRMNKIITIRAGVQSGLDKTEYSELFDSAPYLQLNTPVDFAYDFMLLKGNIIFHPNEKMGLSAGLKWRLADRLPIFVQGKQLGEMSIDYKQGTIAEIIGEGYYYLNSWDKIDASVVISASKLNDYDGSIPYEPNLKANINFRKEIFTNFGANFGIVYVGERKSDILKNNKIDGYVDLKIRADYIINDEFNLFAKLENILNSNIYVFEFYKERGLFASFGAMWRF